MDYIVNAAPMEINLGAQDLSTMPAVRNAVAIPQHLPLCYIYAQKGPEARQLLVGAERDSMYGTDTFDPRKAYYNHSTVFADAMNAEGNAGIYERIIPEDAGPEATIVIWLDVLSTTVDLYAREIDGSISLSALGEPIVSGTAAGYKVKYTATYYSTVEALQNTFGTENILPGTQKDDVTNVVSKRYPIIAFKASSRGSWANFAGIRLWAPTTETSEGMPTKMMAEEKAYPYYFSVIKKPNPATSPSVQKTIYGDEAMMFTFKEGVIDPATDSQLFFGDIYAANYQNLTDVKYPLVYGDFGQVKLFSDNIDALVKLFHAAEASYVNEWSDFTGDVKDAHLFNLVSGVSSANVPYATYQFVDDSDAIHLTQYANNYANGGSDGTMSDEAFALAVQTRLARYMDPDDEVQDLAYNVESIMYDSGYPLATKLAMAYFISIRKDTFAVIGTHTVGEMRLTAAQEHSKAIAIRTRLRNYPESSYFGTPAMRAAIVGCSGKIRDSQYKQYVPLTYEWAIKGARYMGASNGKWKNGKHFDGEGNHVIEHMTDFNITWVPKTARNRFWDVGLNWIQAYDRVSYCIPAYKTIYSEDTSVLTSWKTCMAVCQLNKIAYAAWLEFTGVDRYTPAQRAEKVNAFVSKRVDGIFDDAYVIVPDYTTTDDDLQRGFSGTLPIKLYADNMLTVFTTYVQAYRMSSLNSGS